MKDPSKMVVLHFKFELPNGEFLEREITWAEINDDSVYVPRFKDGPPNWLEGAARSWDHPQDSITYIGKVKAGREEDARAAIFGEDQS